jgi:hypothetical protein
MTNMTYLNVPKLTVLTIHTDHAVVRFDPFPWVQENYHLHLQTDSSLFRRFRFHEINLNENTCKVYPLQADHLSELTIGLHYHFADDYWGERAKLVFDTSRDWQWTQFVPSPQFLIPGPNGTWLGRQLRPDDDPLPDDAEIIPDGHDHEHCRICWEKIGWGGQPAGYRSDAEPQDDWICQSCHDNYVAKRSLEFIQYGEH